MRKVYIYVLKLNQGKYYIGKSIQPKYRMKQHFSGKGSSWTKLYPPIQVVETITSNHPFEEDRMTLEWMQKKGIDHVRGGSFSHRILSSNELMVLQRMMRTDENRCFQCGSEYHFENRCPYKKNEIVIKPEEVKEMVKVPISKENEMEDKAWEEFKTSMKYAFMLTIYATSILCLYFRFIEQTVRL
jgi:predicted GIY-YIG superfamily endonuclease